MPDETKPAAAEAKSKAKKSGWGDALDERTGYRAVLAHAGNEPVRGGARFAYVFGSALLFAILVQIVTGWLLMTVYSPSATTAWASVHYLTFRVSWGWFVRGIHHVGSGAVIVLMLLHLGQTLLFGAYKRPREMNWWFGLLLMGIVLGFSLTGYLLPWDQKGYWATRVATNIMGTVPVLGALIQKLAQGGSSYGHLTLTRFYALHVGVLPALFVLLIVGHVYLFRRHGVTPPTKADLKKSDPFFPKQLAYDVLASMVVLAIVVAIVLKEHGAPLDAPADPSSDYPARPEWYFLSLFQLLKYFKGPMEPVGTILVPGVAALFLFALPLLDRRPGTALKPRAVWIALFGLGLAGAVGLGLMSARADGRDPGFQKARTLADARAKAANELAMKGIPPEGPLVMMEKDPGLRGQQIWDTKCAGCHTIDGKGGNSAPDLMGWGSAEWVAGTMRDPDGATRFGKSPLAGQMPSAIKDVGGQIGMTEDEVTATAAFVGAGSTDKHAKDLFSMRCNGCHAFNGMGDTGNSDLAPKLIDWGTYGWLRAQIASPSGGKTYPPDVSDARFKGHMPAFADDAEVRDDLDVIATWLFMKTKGRAPTPEEIAAASH